MEIKVKNETEMIQFYRMLIEILISLAKQRGNEKAIDDVAQLYYGASTSITTKDH